MLNSDSNDIYKKPVVPEKMVTPKARRTILKVALALAVLGAGNVFFAQHKSQVYLNILLSEPSGEDSIPNITQFSRSIHARYAHISRESESFNKTRARIEFYALVEKGGKSLVALAALLVLMSIWMFRSEQTTNQLNTL